MIYLIIAISSYQIQLYLYLLSQNLLIRLIRLIIETIENY